MVFACKCGSYTITEQKCPVFIGNGNINNFFLSIIDLTRFSLALLHCLMVYIFLAIFIYFRQVHKEMDKLQEELNQANVTLKTQQQTIKDRDKEVNNSYVFFSLLKKKQQFFVFLRRFRRFYCLVAT